MKPAFAILLFLLVSSMVPPPGLHRDALAEPVPDDHWWGFGDWCYPLDACTADDHGFNASVHVLAVFRGEIVAGGPFGAAGGALLDQIGRWDGETWHQLGGGIDHLGCKGLFCFARVNALTVHEGDLIVGGKFRTVDNGRVVANRVARWDGSTWHPIGGGIDEFADPPEAEVYALKSYDGVLVAGGTFYHAEGRLVNGLTYWDGYTWRALGGGVLGGPVKEFAVYDGALVVAGRFYQAGDVAASNIALWDGVAWHPLGGGSDETVQAVAVYGGDLYAAGKFHAQDGSTIWGLGRWDGSAWNAVGTNYGALALCEYNNDLVAASVDLMRWDGTSWLSFGSGLNDAAGTLAVLGTSLFVGGTFTTAGGKTSARIARWDDVITPVAVQDLRAVATAQTVSLTWRLPHWSDIRDIAVERADLLQGPYSVASWLVPEELMTYTDSDVQPGASYWYRLVADDPSGAASTLATLQVSIPLGLETALLAPIPLEGGRRISVRYRIGRPATAVELQAYDVRGKLLRSLERGVREPGEYTQEWDYRTDSGIRLPRGLYIIRLQAGRVSASRKVLAGAD